MRQLEALVRVFVLSLILIFPALGDQNIEFSHKPTVTEAHNQLRIKVGLDPLMVSPVAPADALSPDNKTGRSVDETAAKACTKEELRVLEEAFSFMDTGAIKESDSEYIVSSLVRLAGCQGRTAGRLLKILKNSKNTLAQEVALKALDQLVRNSGGSKRPMVNGTEFAEALLDLLAGPTDSQVKFKILGVIYENAHDNALLKAKPKQVGSSGWLKSNVVDGVVKNFIYNENSAILKQILNNLQKDENEVVRKMAELSSDQLITIRKLIDHSEKNREMFRSVGPVNRWILKNFYGLKNAD